MRTVAGTGCFLVEGKEIKRYKNIEIPDELKKLEYQDFKLDVPLNGAICSRWTHDTLLAVYRRVQYERRPCSFLGDVFTSRRQV